MAPLVLVLVLVVGFTFTPGSRLFTPGARLDMRHLPSSTSASDQGRRCCGDGIHGWREMLNVEVGRVHR